MTDNTFDIRNIPSSKIIKSTKNEWESTYWELPIDNRSSATANKLYFYMLSKSAINWNRRNGKNIPQYFLTDSKTYWSRAEAAKALGCTTKTIQNNLGILLASKMIIKTGKIFMFKPLNCFSPVSTELLCGFMKLEGAVDWVLLLRCYSVLLFAHNEGCNEFTITDLVQTLRIGHSNGKLLALFLNTWEGLGLLELERKKVHHIQFGDYILYSIKRIENTPTSKFKELLFDNGPATEKWKCLTSCLEGQEIDE